MGLSEKCKDLTLIMLLLFLVGCAGLNSYQKDGELRLAGLKTQVTVMRDEKNMPYITAGNLDDALMAQGFVAAQDRLFNMELTRMLVAGRISELAGPETAALDTRMRTIGFYRHAQRQAGLLDPESRRYFQKYIDGVNAFIETRRDNFHLEFKLAGIQPAPWSIVDSLAIVYYMSWDSRYGDFQKFSCCAGPHQCLRRHPGSLCGDPGSGPPRSIPGRQSIHSF